MRPNRVAGDVDQLFPEADKREWPAWLLSIVMHATLLVACGLLAPASAQPPPGEPQRTVGIALVPRTWGNEGGDRHAASTPAEPQQGKASATGQSEAERQLLSNLPSVEGLSGEFATKLPQPQDAAGGTGANLGLPNAAGFIAGAQRGAGKAGLSGQARTQVFGAAGEGSKFVYVFDRSASMGGFEGRPLAAAKQELIKSLGDLQNVHQFQIVFYNERPSIFNPASPAPPTILFATEENRQLAREFVGGITAVGGTRHRQALEAALRMGPDVLFFLTDANEPVLSPGDIAELGRRNRAGAIINCIEFGVGPFSGGDNFLMRLARQNRGQHVYVDVTALGRES